MGQYHDVYNLDKKERIHAHDLGLGLKLLEQMGFKGSTADALFLLVSVSNGRGDGDAPAHPLIGHWGGDRIAIIGDYYEQDDLPGLNFDSIDEFENISGKVVEMLNHVF